MNYDEGEVDEGRSIRPSSGASTKRKRVAGDRVTETLGAMVSVPPLALCGSSPRAASSSSSAMTAMAPSTGGRSRAAGKEGESRGPTGPAKRQRRRPPCRPPRRRGEGRGRTARTKEIADEENQGREVKRAPTAGADHEHEADDGRDRCRCRCRRCCHCDHDIDRRRALILGEGLDDEYEHGMASNCGDGADGQQPRQHRWHSYHHCCRYTPPSSLCHGKRVRMCGNVGRPPKRPRGEEQAERQGDHRIGPPAGGTLPRETAPTAVAATAGGSVPFAGRSPPPPSSSPSILTLGSQDAMTGEEAGGSIFWLLPFEVLERVLGALADDGPEWALPSRRVCARWWAASGPPRHARGVCTAYAAAGLTSLLRWAREEVGCAWGKRTLRAASRAPVRGARLWIAAEMDGVAAPFGDADLTDDVAISCRHVAQRAIAAAALDAWRAGAVDSLPPSWDLAVRAARAHRCSVPRVPAGATPSGPYALAALASRIAASTEARVDPSTGAASLVAPRCTPGRCARATKRQIDAVLCRGAHDLHYEGDDYNGNDNGGGDAWDGAAARRCQEENRMPRIEDECGQLLLAPAPTCGCVCEWLASEGDVDGFACAVDAWRIPTAVARCVAAAARAGRVAMVLWLVKRYSHVSYRFQCPPTPGSKEARQRGVPSDARPEGQTAPLGVCMCPYEPVGLAHPRVVAMRHPLSHDSLGVKRMEYVPNGPGGVRVHSSSIAVRAAAAAGRADVVAALIAAGPEWDHDVTLDAATAAAAAGSTECLDLLLSDACRRPRRPPDDRRDGPERGTGRDGDGADGGHPGAPDQKLPGLVALAAARGGSAGVLRWASVRWPRAKFPVRDLLVDAARGGSVAALEWTWREAVASDCAAALCCDGGLVEAMKHALTRGNAGALAWLSERPGVGALRHLRRDFSCHATSAVLAGHLDALRVAARIGLISGGRSAGRIGPATDGQRTGRKRARGGGGQEATTRATGAGAGKNAADDDDGDAWRAGPPTDFGDLHEAAALQGNLECIEWSLKELGNRPTGRHVCANLARAGRLGGLMWACRRGFSCAGPACLDAAVAGRLDVAVWLRAAGAVPLHTTLVKASRAARAAAVVAWMREAGYPTCEAEQAAVDAQASRPEWLAGPFPAARAATYPQAALDAMVRRVMEDQRERRAFGVERKHLQALRNRIRHKSRVATTALAPRGAQRPAEFAPLAGDGESAATGGVPVPSSVRGVDSIPAAGVPHVWSPAPLPVPHLGATVALALPIAGPLFGPLRGSADPIPPPRIGQADRRTAVGTSASADETTLLPDHPTLRAVQRLSALPRRPVPVHALAVRTANPLLVPVPMLTIDLTRDETDDGAESSSSSRTPCTANLVPRATVAVACHPVAKRVPDLFVHAAGTPPPHPPPHSTLRPAGTAAGLDVDAELLLAIEALDRGARDDDTIASWLRDLLTSRRG